MSQARGSLRQVTYGPETVFGVTPATPSTQSLEYKDAKFRYQAGEVVDDSVNMFRQTTSTRKGNTTVGLDLDGYLCQDNYDPFLEAGFLGTWTSNVLKVANVVNANRRSFYFEEGFPDVEGGKYQVFNGMVVNSIKFDFPSDNTFCSVQFGFLGTKLSDTEPTSIDATPTPLVAKQKYYHTDGDILIDSVIVGNVISGEIMLDNGYDQTFTFGNPAPYDLPFGNASITGKLVSVLDTMTQWDNYKDGMPVAISVTLGIGGESYTLLIPQAKYTNGSIVTSGDSGITVEFDFRAEYNTTEATSMKLTRVT